MLLQTGCCVAYLIVISQLLGGTVVGKLMSEAEIILIVSLLVAPLTCLRKVGDLVVFNVVADVLLLVASAAIFWLEAEQLGLVSSSSVSGLSAGREGAGPAAAAVRSSSDSARTTTGGQASFLELDEEVLQPLTTLGTPVGAKIPIAFGTICLVFEGIANALPTYDETDAPTRAKFGTLYVGVFAFIMAFFITAGLCGLAAFGSATAPIVLSNFSANSLLVVVIRYAFAVALVFTYPFALLPALRLLEAGLFGGRTAVTHCLGHFNLVSGIRMQCKVMVCYSRREGHTRRRGCPGAPEGHPGGIRGASGGHPGGIRGASGGLPGEADGRWIKFNDNSRTVDVKIPVETRNKPPDKKELVGRDKSGLGSSAGAAGAAPGRRGPTASERGPLLRKNLRNDERLSSVSSPAGTPPSSPEESPRSSPSLASSPVAQHLLLQFAMFRVFVVAVLGAIAIAGRDHLDNVNSLVGSLCGVPLVFLYPPIAHLRQ